MVIQGHFVGCFNGKNLLTFLPALRGNNYGWLNECYGIIHGKIYLKLKVTGGLKFAERILQSAQKNNFFFRVDFFNCLIGNTTYRILDTFVLHYA